MIRLDQNLLSGIMSLRPTGVDTNSLAPQNVAVAAPEPAPQVTAQPKFTFLDPDLDTSSFDLQAFLKPQAPEEELTPVAPTTTTAPPQTTTAPPPTIGPQSLDDFTRTGPGGMRYLWNGDSYTRDQALSLINSGYGYDWNGNATIPQAQTQGATTTPGPAGSPPQITTLPPGVDGNFEIPYIPPDLLNNIPGYTPPGGGGSGIYVPPTVPGGSDATPPPTTTPQPNPGQPPANQFGLVNTAFDLVNPAAFQYLVDRINAKAGS